jgi:hypothetical protein
MGCEFMDSYGGGRGPGSAACRVSKTDSWGWGLLLQERRAGTVCSHLCV